MNAFNLLQDLRHLIILDFRTEEQFKASHIRKAVRVEVSDYKEKIAESLVTLHEKSRPGANTDMRPNSNADMKVEAKKAIEALQSKQKIDGTKFKSQYHGDDLKGVLFIFPEGDSRSLEQ